MEAKLTPRVSTAEAMRHPSGMDLLRCKSRWPSQQRHPRQAAKIRTGLKIQLLTGDRSRTEMTL